MVNIPLFSWFYTSQVGAGILPSTVLWHRSIMCVCVCFFLGIRSRSQPVSPEFAANNECIRSCNRWRALEIEKPKDERYNRCLQILQLLPKPTTWNKLTNMYELWQRYLFNCSTFAGHLDVMNHTTKVCKQKHPMVRNDYFRWYY